MLRAFALLLFAALLACFGVVVGWAADQYQVSALLLVAEPLLLVAALWAVNVARWTRKPGLSLALSMGTVGAFAAVRLPMPIDLPGGAPPVWSESVSRCAASLKPPQDDTKLLQWTLTGDESPEDVRAVVREAGAQVVVLHGVREPAVVGAVLEEVGGESQFHPPAGAWPGVAIVAAGGFHACGEPTEWSDGLDTESGYTLAFVGVPPRTVFPLLVTRLPSPLEGSGWGERMRVATDRLYDVVGGVGGASLVVVADAPAPRTFRYLDGRLLALGLGSVAVPPNWPARIGPLPSLTVHPFTRVWAGPIWQNARAVALGAQGGTRAPVLTTLTGFPTEDAGQPPVEVPEHGVNDPTLENVPAEPEAP